MYKVLVTARSFGKDNQEPFRFLEENGCNVLKLPYSGGNLEAQLEEHIKDADAVVAGLEEYSAELINTAKNLKVISRYGVGYEKVNLEAARKNGIAVTITPGANENSVADLAMSLMLCAARNISFMDNSIKNGKIIRPTGIEMWQKTLGVVGLGRIGKGVVKRAKGFEMKILCYDMYHDQDFAEKYGVTYCDFDTLVAQSDFITIHAPLTESTRGMFADTQFNSMKKIAVLVNTARGGIVDEDALYRALKEGKIAAAALDATVCEPPIGSPLTELSNCILTPHAGASTYEASYNMGMMAAKNALNVLNGETCPYIVK